MDVCHRNGTWELGLAMGMGMGMGHGDGAWGLGIGIGDDETFAGDGYGLRHERRHGLCDGAYNNGNCANEC